MNLVGRILRVWLDTRAAACDRMEYSRRCVIYERDGDKEIGYF